MILPKSLLVRVPSFRMKCLQGVQQISNWKLVKAVAQKMSENASVALTSVDSHLEINDNEASEAQPGTVPIPQASSSNPSSESAADTAVRNSTEVQSVSAEKGTLPTIHHTVGTKSSEIQKDSVNDKSQPNTHKEALHANPSEKQPSTFHDNPKGKGGLQCC